jgi:hypothetical protein
MLDGPANTETLVPHMYQITQCHIPKHCNINIQLLWEPRITYLFIVCSLSHPEIVFLFARLYCCVF